MGVFDLQGGILEVGLKPTAATTVVTELNSSAGEDLVSVGKVSLLDNFGGFIWKDDGRSHL